jgi:hypothetical protein
LSNPFLPAFLRETQIRGLRIGPGTIDLTLTRLGEGVAVDVTRADGGVSFLNPASG